MTFEVAIITASPRPSHLLGAAVCVRVYAGISLVWCSRIKKRVHHQPTSLTALNKKENREREDSPPPIVSPCLRESK